MKSETFILPRRTHTPFGVLGIIVIVAILGLFIAPAVAGRQPTASAAGLSALANGKMYWTAASLGKIQRANLDGSSVEDLVTGLSAPLGIALDLTAGKMYWTDGPQGKIQRAGLDGTSVADLVTGLSSPLGIALDLAGGKMYYVIEGSQGAGAIGRANLDGSSPQTLVTGLGDGRFIALDLINGKMYWTDAGYDHIRRANLDGTNAETMVTGQTGPFGIALDVAGGKMYWTDSSDEVVRRANLDGTGIETLVNGTAGTGIALDLVNGKMYWDNIVPATPAKIQRANLDGSGVEDVATGLSLPIGIALDISSFTYDFSGFFQPVDTPPTVNTVKAGQAIPVKFSLNGDYGLNILAVGYPKSQTIPCTSTDPVAGIEETVAAGSSSLSYDASTGHYIYVWKTDKAWATTCRQLVVQLNDGTSHRANFQFKK